MLENVLINNLPSIDLHGTDGDIAVILVNDFINDNLKLKKKKIVIIHGIGEGILKRRIHESLKKNPNVIDYKLHIYNEGMTIVDLKSENFF